ncbi:LysM peptidoglycan-binding domain-containing protein [Streptomyces himalayensis]|uniref:LysM peptidoglycan-binding domain-containing protein n=1 Tax=Streptomyces himalayensis subsp. himalayensis TaxID=2756131 RepID=A0A7W0DQZ2_9ACTN|nr:LysM peptidoglycan-binding domain-containing protein [Streptomyces himalayensis]MBA2949634.1 LysM peptidoglycan-binding domain-containing protein [Streptomyces himalayensis subsp. himalayensis]
MRTHAPAAQGRTLARVLKAVLSLMVLAGVVAGLPLLLAWATPVVWAISHDDLMHLLDRQDTGAAFLVLLIAVGWAGWAQFAFCAARELVAQLRGLTWHAPRGLGASQRAAAALIGSILVLLPAGSALATPAQAAPAQSAARLPGQAQAERSLDADQHAAAPVSTSETRTYTVRGVRPAESLWSIAEKELGDGECWRDIAELNEGRTMVDGQVFRANSFLQPGWQLRLPATATAGDAGAQAAGGVGPQMKDSAPAATSQEGHAATVTVKSGDYLSKIAEEQLGDGDQWPELFEASRGKPQPGDLPAITDPDVIYAGQQVVVPGAQPDKHDLPQQNEQGEESGGEGRTPPAAEEPDGDQAREGDAQAPAPSRSTAPAPEAPAPSTSASRPAQQPGQGHGAPSATPRPNTGTSSTSPSASAESSTSDTSSPTATASPAPAPSAASSPLQMRTVVGAGALLAAAVTGALAVRRLLQRRRRKPGQKIAIAPEPSAAEAQLSAVAEPAGAARLDIALRTLAHHLAQDENRELPRLRAARIGARSLKVLPEDLAQQPQAPFIAGRNGWWTLPADAVLLNEEAAREVPAPYPGLVTVGSAEAGELVLLNLAAVPALLLDGNPVHITEVCTSLALELGMSPWASEVEIVTIGFGEDLPQLLPTSRIAHMRQPAHALRDLTERLLEAHQMPEASHQPYLLLCASTLDADTAWQFADAIDKADRVPVTLIAPASSAAAHFPQAEILNASLSDPQHLDYAGLDVTVQRLEHAAYQQITTALALSGQPAHPAKGPWRDVPGEPDSARQPEPLAAKETTAHKTDTAGIPSSSAQDISCSEVFPALLAASADPPRLHLLPAMDAPGQAGAEAELAEDAKDAPDTDAAQTPSSQAAAWTPARGETSDATIEAHDPHAPEIRVLGPVEVTGVRSTGHGPRQAQLAALLYFRPHRTADVLCADMDPLNPWLASTLNARLQGLRRALGNDVAGNAYVPRRRTGDDPYQLSPAVRCDWTRFVQLAERALPHGPAGLADLEKALGLVRGRPFGSRPLPWAEPYQQEMITRIIDIAHTVATYRTPPGPDHDLSVARQAIVTGLDVDETAELLYRDWMRIEHTAGNRTGLHTAITRLQQINRALDCSLEIETEQLINDLLGGAGSGSPAHTAL